MEAERRGVGEEMKSHCEETVVETPNPKRQKVDSTAGTPPAPEEPRAGKRSAEEEVNVPKPKAQKKSESSDGGGKERSTEEKEKETAKKTAAEEKLMKKKKDEEARAEKRRQTEEKKQKKKEEQEQKKIQKEAEEVLKLSPGGRERREAGKKLKRCEDDLKKLKECYKDAVSAAQTFEAASERNPDYKWLKENDKYKKDLTTQLYTVIESSTDLFTRYLTEGLSQMKKEKKNDVLTADIDDTLARTMRGSRRKGTGG
eukprot:9125764-Pyramimonas_sp.AAC.1